MPGWAQNMYNQKYFPNPDNFDPARWLNADDKELAFIFTPFSVGSRNCLGQNFALLETKIVLIKMVNQFKMALRPGYKHLLKTNSLYGPVNPIIIDLQDC
jgi:cytochrome P450 family 4